MLYADPVPPELKPILESFVEALVEYPEYADVHETEEDGVTIYTIDVVPDDRGKVIGARGVIIRSLGDLFYAMGCKQRRKVRIRMKG